MININKRWVPHIVAGVIITLAWTFWSGDNYWTWLIMLAMFLTGSIGGGLLIDRHNRSLIKRIQADEVVTWDVLMNGVNVGTVTDAQYAAMHQSAFNDWHNAMNQFFIVGRVIQTIIIKLCIFVPFASFWVVAATVIFSPESFSELVQEIQNTAPSEIILAAKSFLNLCITLSMITIGFMFVIGRQFRFKDVYSDTVARMVRQHLRIPAEGDIDLIRLGNVNFQHKSNSL